MKQRSLFDPTDAWPPGLRYVEEFITPAEEMRLLQLIQGHELTHARYKSYTARRRTLHFGFGYDFEHNTLTPAGPIPAALVDLRGSVARAAGLAAGDFVQALFTEYQPGTPLGWHRDVPDYEVIAGISLGNAARMRFRPWPVRENRRESVMSLELEPRSLYLMQGEARWGWQHAVPPTRALRYSITFRTLRTRAMSD